MENCRLRGCLEIMFEDAIDLEKLFLWFCKNHIEDAKGDLKPLFEKVHKNLKSDKNLEENDEIFEQLWDDNSFLEFIKDNSAQVFSMEHNYEYYNGIFKWYEYYFVEGTDLETVRELNLNDALWSGYIVMERNSDIVDIDYDTAEITWERMQVLMTCIKSRVEEEIIVNGNEYEQINIGTWSLSKTSAVET